jgi:hypothetical protein
MAGDADFDDVLAGRSRWVLLRGRSRSCVPLPDACVDAVITDPPYSSGGFTRSDRLEPTSNKYVQTGTKLERPEFAGDTRDQHSFAYGCAL